MINISDRTKYVSLFLFLVVMLLVMIALAGGEKILSPVDVSQSLMGWGSKYNNMVVQTLRLPRVVVAFFVGASLALSGAILQSVIKNPLASPDILGIVDAGGVGTLVFYTLFMEPKNNSLQVSIVYLPIFAFLFAMSAIVLVYLFCRKNVAAYRIILIGIGLSALFKALKNILIINGPVVFIKEAATWVTGTIYGTQHIHALIITVWFFIFFIITILFIKELNIQMLDDGLVTALGSRLTLNRFMLLFIAAALTAGSVAVGGGISFIGLIGPHIARKMVGSKFENLLPVSVLIGGIIGLTSDMVAKWILYPTELPMGIFTALIGAPYFIYLLIRGRKTM